MPPVKRHWEHLEAQRPDMSKKRNPLSLTLKVEGLNKYHPVWISGQDLADQMIGCFFYDSACCAHDLSAEARLPKVLQTFMNPIRTSSRCGGGRNGQPDFSQRAAEMLWKVTMSGFGKISEVKLVTGPASPHPAGPGRLSLPWIFWVRHYLFVKHGSLFGALILVLSSSCYLAQASAAKHLDPARSWVSWMHGASHLNASGYFGSPMASVLILDQWIGLCEIQREVAAWSQGDFLRTPCQVSVSDITDISLTFTMHSLWSQKNLDLRNACAKVLPAGIHTAQVDGASCAVRESVSARQDASIQRWWTFYMR